MLYREQCGDRMSLWLSSLTSWSQLLHLEPWTRLPSVFTWLWRSSERLEAAKQPQPAAAAAAAAAKKNMLLLQLGMLTANSDTKALQCRANRSQIQAR